MNVLSEIKSCEVCGSDKLESILNLGSHPLCDDLVPLGNSKICQEYPIEILFCRLCITAHQRFQVSKKELFPQAYHYRSRFTADVLNGMSELVNSCEKRLSTLANKTVLDIGCNDGSLLNFFRDKGSLTIGIEPTDAYIDALKNQHTIYSTYLSEELTKKIIKDHGHPDVITFTNVFAHIENLAEVISAIKKLLCPSTMIVIENHYLGSVLSRNQFDTFYHEHPRSYSYSSFIEIAKNIGISIQGVEFPSRYGGNIRIFMGGPNTSYQLEDSKKILEDESNYLDKFVNLRFNIKKWQENKGKIIEKVLKKNKNIPGKAFPGRAAILLKLLGIDNTIMPFVSEKPGSMKIGHYVPGTRIPIISDNELFNRQDKIPSILNLAWHISKEIRSYMLSNGFEGEIIDILNDRDF